VIGQQRQQHAVQLGALRRPRAGDSTGAFKAFLTLARPFQLAAATPLHVATTPEIAGVTGAYFEKRRPVNPSALALDRGLAERVWALSERLVAETGE
jgi:retinol dehydrogenase 12